MDIHTVDPTQYDRAIIEAENDCLKVIAEALSLTIGNDAFLGIKADKAIDCAVFDIGRPETNELAGFPAHTYHFRGQLDLYNRDRETIQRWEMRLLYLFPIQTSQSTGNRMPERSNVDQFRLSPSQEFLDPITTVDIPVGKLSENKTVEVFTTSAYFDIVFNAGVRPQK